MIAFRNIPFQHHPIGMGMNIEILLQNKRSIYFTLTDFKKGIEREIGEMQKSYANLKSALII